MVSDPKRLQRRRIAAILRPLDVTVFAGDRASRNLPVVASEQRTFFEFDFYAAIFKLDIAIVAWQSWDLKCACRIPTAQFCMELWRVGHIQIGKRDRRAECHN